MLSTTLPPLPPTPSASPAAPPAHGNSASQAADKGPDSFSRLLDKAGDTRREADAASAPDEGPAASRATPGKGKPTRTDTRPPPGPATAAPTRDSQPQDIPAATEALAPATEDDVGTDATSLLASLAGLAPPPGTPAAAAASAGAQAAARHALGTESQAAGSGRAASAESTTATLSALSGAAEQGARLAADKAMPDKSTVAAADAALTRQWNAAVGTEAGRGAAADTTPTAAPAAMPRFEAAAPTALPQALAPATAAPTGPAPAAQATLSASPGSADFASQLGAQLSTFVREGVHHARLELHPTELGPVTVNIQLDGANAQVNFAAEHAQTRQALEQALPTLAGSLREAGLTLSGGGVFEQPPQPQPDSSQPRPDGRRGADTGMAAGQAEAPARPAASPRRRGVVDLVA